MTKYYEVGSYLEFISEAQQPDTRVVDAIRQVRRLEVRFAINNLKIPEDVAYSYMITRSYGNLNSNLTSKLARMELWWPVLRRYRNIGRELTFRELAIFAEEAHKAS